MTPAPPAPEDRSGDADVADLRRAIDDGDVRPWYQPIVRLTTGELVGFEALARWHRPSGVVELPGVFIGVAEESGLITALDLAVLDRAMGDLARWREVRPDLRMSINISARQLDDDDWAEAVHASPLRHGVPPGNIDLELTETARPRDLSRASVQLRRLRQLGYAVWFDDFGTGWSELAHVVEVPVDGIKIDRFFTERLGTRADAVVRAMLDVAAALGLATTIEGISSREQAERAQALGCDLAQGFWWSEPLSAPATEELLASAGPVLWR